MSEIPCKLARQLIDGAVHFGIAEDDVVSAAGLAMDRVRDPRGRVSWDEFIALHEALERLGLSDDDFVTLGATMPRAGYHPLLVGIGHHVVSARQFYLAAGRWFTPSVFPMVRLTHRDLADGRLEVVFDIPSHYRGSKSFFLINQGVVAAMPTLIGLPAAEIEGEIDTHRAVYRVRPPVQRSVRRRARSWLRALASSRYLVGEVVRQQEEIASGYRALVRARHDFHQVIESLPHAVLVCRSGQPIYANRAACAAFGGVAAARLTVPGYLLGLVCPDDREVAAQLLAGRGVEPSSSREISCCLPGEAQTVWLEFARPRSIEFEGQPALLLAARDISQRKRMEAELVRSERLAAFGQLLANVSHELSNPLTYVDLNLEVLAGALAGSPDETALVRARAAIASAREGSERAQMLLRDLAAFLPSREEERERVDLIRVADAAVALASVELASHHLIKEYRPAPAVVGSSTRLEQVVVNLLRNAAQACDPPGKIRLRVDADGSDHVLLEVSDDGPGIAPELLDRIFDPFFTTKPIGVGTGLGLAISRELVARKGGTLEVASTPGQGARFTVRLPAAAEQQVPVTAIGSAPDLRLPRASPCRRRVLVIDDEPSLTEILREVLGERHDVVVVQSGEAALAYLDGDSAFDVILCDVMMRGITGMELYERLVTSHPELAARITFMTGGAYSDAAREFLSRVANRCLDKPFALDDVLAAVEQAPPDGWPSQT